MDPPFNKKKQFTAPIESSARGANFFRYILERKHVKNDWVEIIKEDYDGIHKFLLNVKELSSFQSRKNKHYLYNYCYFVLYGDSFDRNAQGFKRYGQYLFALR